MDGVSLRDRLKSLGPVALVAKRAKVSRATLYKAFEREKIGEAHNMDDATVRKIAGAFDKTETWIRSGDDPAQKPAPDTLQNARLVAKLAVSAHEITDRDAWLMLYSLNTDDNTVEGLFAAMMAKLRADGVPQRVPPQRPPGEPRKASSRR